MEPSVAKVVLGKLQGWSFWRSPDKALEGGQSVDLNRGLEHQSLAPLCPGAFFDVGPNVEEATGMGALPKPGVDLADLQSSGQASSPVQDQNVKTCPFLSGIMR